MMSNALLSIEGLSVTYRTGRGRIFAITNLSMTVPAGVAVGVVGESGCGKTTLAKSVMGLLPSNGRIEGGGLRFEGHDLTRCSAAEWRQRRWKQIAMVPQSAMNALNPVYRVGDQLVETMVVREKLPAPQARSRAAQLFEQVGIPSSRLSDYPHQFSGGMKQRATIALALCLSPKLIIADEPTTALDVLVEARILDLLQRLRREYGLTLIYITHDLSVVARTCDLMGVMYAGELVEFGPTAEVIREPLHPYTMGLVAAVPRGQARLWEPIAIPGSPPEWTRMPGFCGFAPRCPFCAEPCRQTHPGLRILQARHQAACHYAEEAGGMRQESLFSHTWRRSQAARMETA